MSAENLAAKRLILPPPFAGFAMGRGDSLDLAEAEAHRGAGTLLWREAGGVLALAAVLEPAPPLVATPQEADLGFLASLAALGEALARHGPPERRLGLLWPDVILCDGARLGGARWRPGPPGADGLPLWAIFAAELLAEREGLEETGLHPDSTSLAEEGFGAAEDLVESFAAHLKLIVDRWSRQGPEAVLRPLLDRIHGPDSLPGAEIRGGRLVLPPLAGALNEARWRDPARGGPQW